MRVPLLILVAALALTVTAPASADPWRIHAARQARLQTWACEASKALPRTGYPKVRWTLPVQARRLETLRFWRGMLTHCRRARASTAAVICRVFGPYCSQAISVARCESHLFVWARNGQYLGLFQMGSYARSRYGHGPDALTQARAAYRYFVGSGRDWSPWQCKP